METLQRIEAEVAELKAHVGLSGQPVLSDS